MNTSSYEVVAMAGTVFLHSVSRMSAILPTQKPVPLLKSTNPAVSLFSWLYLLLFSSSGSLFFTAGKEPALCGSLLLCGASGTGPQLGHLSRRRSLLL